MTHELASILAIADRCIMLDRAAYPDAGGMIAEGDPRVLRDTSTHPTVRAFFRREIPAMATGVMRLSGIYLRVGLLILGGLALLVAMIWFLGGARISSGTLYESYFSELVQGLEVGAAVKYRGVTIGRVSEIGLVSAAYGQGEVIEKDAQTVSVGLCALRRRHLKDRPDA